jgi:hypothetical protein
MTRAPGKSCILGLLLATLAFFSTACHNISTTGKGLPQPDNRSFQRAKLLVQENGLFAVTQKDLTHFGLEIGEFSTAGLRLSQGGKTVPILVSDDRLIFYGQAPQSRYTNVRPYILEIGQQGTAIQETAAPDLTAPLITDIPQTIHLEENHIYTAEARQDDNDDVWFWSKLRQQETFDTEFEIPNISAAPALMRVNTWGFTYSLDIEGDHDFDLLLNDELIGTVVWDGQIHNSSDTTIPAGTLTQGTNTITLDNRSEGASFLDIMHVNWLELEYQAPATAVNDRLAFSTVDGLVQMSGFSDKPLIFNISDAANPELMVDWKYDGQQVHLPVSKDMVIAVAGPDGYDTPTIEAVRESDWHNPEQQADLIIITTDELAPSLAPLVHAREAQGLSVALVPVAEIYDEFGYGETTPESIREFVAYAYANWQEPHSRYLFLVGDATTDYLEYVAELPRNVVPSPLVPVQFSGETVSDSRLSDVDGDRRPDLAVGRWPVRTVKEVENLVERTLAYEQGPASDRVIFAADGSETRFSNIVEYLIKASQLPAEQIQQLNGPQAREITEQWNEGAWLTTYVGHGSITRWGKEDIFNLDTVSSLKSKTPPIVLQLTCLTGLFSHPSETSLTEEMLSHPDGPVLTVAATSLTLSGHQEPFAIELLQQMQDSNIIRIGDAFQEAKLSLEIDNVNGLREISDTFTLFGDPSTTMVRP